METGGGHAQIHDCKYLCVIRASTCLRRSELLLSALCVHGIESIDRLTDRLIGKGRAIECREGCCCCRCGHRSIGYDDDAGRWGASNQSNGRDVMKRARVVDCIASHFAFFDPRQLLALRCSMPVDVLPVLSVSLFVFPT